MPAPTAFALTASRVTRAHGISVVLDDVDVAVGPESRIGVVGPNGVGKSTLLRLLAGTEPPDSGRVTRSPATLAVGYLAQEDDAVPGETLRAALGRLTGAVAAEEQLGRTSAALGSGPEADQAYADALERYLALGAADLDARAEEVCEDLGLPADRLDVELVSLSGGQRARARLAAILLSRFDVLLLDEPTNDLDFDGLDRLERFLHGVPGGVVVVSHDRAFLERTIERVVEIDEATHRSTEFGGGWAGYLEARAVARRHQYEAHTRYTRARDELVDRARRQRRWAQVGVKQEARKPRDNDKAQRDFRINNTEKLAGKVRITEKRLERLETERVDKPWEGWQLDMTLPTGRRSGDVVARLTDAVVDRGAFRLGPIDVEVSWADRIAVLGPNGSGKTTLLHALLGRLPLAAGQHLLGPGVVVGEMDQARQRFGGEEPLLEAFARASSLRPGDARALLAKFGLGAQHVVRPAATLSPGERTRAVLGLLMAAGTNCLVLDEPTNHLDLPAIEQIEQALDTYEGTLLLVTHDRALLDHVRVTRTIDVTRLC